MTSQKSFFVPNIGWKMVVNMVFSIGILLGVIYVLSLFINFAYTHRSADLQNEIARIAIIIIAGALILFAAYSISQYVRGCINFPLLIDAPRGCIYRDEKVIMIDQPLFRWEYYLLRKRKRLIYLPSLARPIKAIIYPNSGRQLSLEFNIRYRELNPKNIIRLIGFFGKSRVSSHLIIPVSTYKKLEAWVNDVSSLSLRGEEVKKRLLRDLGSYFDKTPLKITSAEFLTIRLSA